MASKTFSAREWYNNNGVNKREKCKTAGLTYVLVGQVTEATDANFAKLAKEQVDLVKVSKPKIATDSGATETQGSGMFTGEKLAALIIGCANADKVEGFTQE